MTPLVRAEMLKLRTTRTTGWLLLATIATEALMLAFSIPKRGAPDALVPLDDPGLLADVVGTGLLISQVLVAVFAVMAFSQEHRYQTITSTYLVEPRRPRVLLAKLAAATLSSVVVVIATLVLVVPVGIILIGSRDGNATLGAQFWEVVAAGFFLLAATAAIGVAVGALVRHQVAAVVGVLVWMTAVEHVVIPALPQLGRWLPGGATLSVMQQGPANGLDGELLPAAAGGLVLLGYAVLAIALAAVVAPRRDVL
jgi:ABC-type transport system involved in multi-copper enzyme maturation permease subunit